MVNFVCNPTPMVCDQKDVSEVTGSRESQITRRPHVWTQPVEPLPDLRLLILKSGGTCRLRLHALPHLQT